MPKCLTLSALLLALPLCANPSGEAPFPGENLMGVQGRGSLPGADLADAVGSSTPGIGASVQVELHFEPYRFERDQCRFCARLGMGVDSWRMVGGSPGRSVTAYQVGIDGLYFFRDDGREFLNGPYLMVGAEGITWAVGAKASDTGAPERVIRAGFSAGFGYRLNRRVDAELKIMGSQVDPALKIATTMVCLNYWF